MLNKFFLLMCITTVLMACQTTPSIQKKVVKKSPIKRVNYYLRYIESGKELQAEVMVLSDSSDFVLLSGIKFDQEKMKAQRLPAGWKYKRIKRRAAIKAVHYFNYMLDAETERLDSIVISPLKNLKVATPQFSKKSGGLLTWEGPALTQDQAMTIIIEDSKGEHYSINHVGISRGALLEIRPEHLEAIAKGPASLSIIEKQDYYRKEEPFSRFYKSEYYRNKVKIEITD